ncbi:MAG TPA: hypothetical protein VGN81_39185 [Pseudonocardiaceae bacterium]
MVEHRELLAIHRALDELAEQVARLRAECALLLHASGHAQPDWTDDEGLGGFASTLGRSA